MPSVTNYEPWPRKWHPDGSHSSAYNIFCPSNGGGSESAQVRSQAVSPTGLEQGRAVRQLGGLIIRRSEVRILPLLHDLMK